MFYSQHLQLMLVWIRPRDLLTWFQELGRGSKDGPSSPSTCMLLADIKSFVNIVHQIHRSTSDNGDETEPDLNPICGLNSAIKNHPMLSTQTPTPTTRKKDKFDLTVNCHRQVTYKRLRKIMNVLK